MLQISDMLFYFKTRMHQRRLESKIEAKFWTFHSPHVKSRRLMGEMAE